MSVGPQVQENTGAPPQKRWCLAQPDDGKVRVLIHELGVSLVLARLLVTRGVEDVESARRFLHPSLSDLHDPRDLAGVDEAVSRIMAALQQGDRMCVFGDYDVDGITSVVLLVRVLTHLGGTVDWYIPHRLEEGYGLNASAVDRIIESGAKLIITSDCGISGKAEVERAAERGVDVVVTDHHEPGSSYPDTAVAVVDPRRSDCEYPFGELSGVGVVFKVLQVLLGEMGHPPGPSGLHPLLEESLDIVALGTIADVVPLVGENRVLASVGLEKLAETRNVGLRALMRVAGVRREKVGSTRVSFGLAPRLNAVGRLKDAGAGVRLLLTDDPAEAARLADELNQANSSRQGLEADVLEEALGMLDDGPLPPFIVLASDGWHPGVIGVVASRLVERFYRPVLLIALDGDMGKGSGRSITGFHLLSALESCAEHLMDFGGHAMAAGVTMTRDQIEGLSAALAEVAAQALTAEDMVPTLNVDARVSLDEIDDHLMEAVTALAPHGSHNRKPVFMSCGLEVAGCPKVVGKNHLKLGVREQSKVLEAIGFRLGEQLPIAEAGNVDVAYSIEYNDWRGRRSIQLTLKDIRPSSS